MRQKVKNTLAIGAGALILVAATAGASTYILTQDDMPKASEQDTGTFQRASTTQAAPAPQPACDDDNIVGKVVGGVAGGVAGSQFGSGNGKTAATIGGSVGGQLLGEEYIPTRNATCR